MAISELYVVQHLLQETVAPGPRMLWHEKDTLAYSTRENGVEIALHRVHSRTGSRLFLSLTQGFDEVQIAEPIAGGIVRARYDTEDERQLAAALRQLATAVTQQCEDRKIAAMENRDAVRQTVFHQLLFGSTAASARDIERAEAFQ